MKYLLNAAKILNLSNGRYTIADIKQSYRKLASVNHPDKGGNTHLMQLINNAFTELTDYLKDNDILDLSQEHSNDAELDFSFLEELKLMSGIIIEVCGSWVWLRGDTISYKEQISKLGFKFSGSKKSWYWSPTISALRKKRGFRSMTDIRKVFGSIVVSSKPHNTLSLNK
jgi:hypothetical protein